MGFAEVILRLVLGAGIFERVGHRVEMTHVEMRVVRAVTQQDRHLDLFRVMGRRDRLEVYGVRPTRTDQRLVHFRRALRHPGMVVREQNVKIGE